MAAELAFKAAEEGDRAFCGRDDHQTLEAKKKLLSLRDEDGRTLVHVAAAGGQVEVRGATWTSRAFSLEPSYGVGMQPVAHSQGSIPEAKLGYRHTLAPPLVCACCFYESRC